MKTLLVLLSLISLNSFAATAVECTAESLTFYVQNTNQSEIRISFNGEEVVADGILDKNEVDLIAKFKSVGEISLFAKVGQKLSDNYVYIQGKRILVFCR